jgi:hypothetical protein
MARLGPNCPVLRINLARRVGGTLSVTDVTRAPVARQCRKRNPNAAKSNKRGASAPTIVELR